MANGKKDSKARLKRVAKDSLPEGAEAPEGATQAGKRRWRGKGSEGSPAAPGRQKKPGRVVATGTHAPMVSDLEAEAAQKADKSAKPDGYEFGRPTDYRPEYGSIARAMCRLGATDFDLAQEFGVSTFTIWKWRSKYEDFSNALLE